jgi:hypothetical protein
MVRGVHKDPDAAFISIVGVQITERISKENKNTTRSLTFCTKAPETKNGKAIGFVGSSSSISTAPMIYPSLTYCFATGDRAIWGGAVGTHHLGDKDPLI